MHYDNVSNKVNRLSLYDNDEIPSLIYDVELRKLFFANVVHCRSKQTTQAINNLPNSRQRKRLRQDYICTYFHIIRTIDKKAI